MKHEYQTGEPLYSEPSKFDLWMDTEGKLIKENIQKNKYHCFICKTKKNLTIHHILPKSMGGIDLPENRVKLCKQCHDELHLYLNSKLNVTEKYTLERLDLMRRKFSERKIYKVVII